MRLDSFFLFFVFAGFVVHAQQLAFPGAEGFGRYATGGRGGEILVVSNLNDSGPGSFREALIQKHPRIIIFSVAGNIQLEKELDIKYGNVSILGQSAPGDGITVRDYPIKATKVENVIIRYIRSRLGDESEYQGDAISITGCKNVIVDHCSFSWATDECASIYDNENLTLQYAIISESLNKSVHAKGEHGYGGIWGGKKASFHHNLFAHHKSRNPRFHGARYHKQPEMEIVDFRNNVIYNWQSNNSYGGEEGNHNIVNNYYVSGPATSSKKDKILDPYDPFGRFYVSGNVLVGDEEVTNNNWKGVKDFENHPEIKLREPLVVEAMPTQDASVALQTVIASSGASYRSDPVDRRVLQEVRSRGATFGTGIINSQSEVGGWPVLDSGKLKKDKDADGIPDIWEKRNGLNPKDPDDAVTMTINEGYSNIEVYLNELLQ